MKPLVVCIKVGNKYTADYVNILHAMLARHTTRDYHFVCLTDDVVGVIPECIPIETLLPGWWSKLVLFKPQQILSNRNVVFLDLDTVICDNVDFLFNDFENFYILKDFWASGYNSSVMAMRPSKYRAIWNDFDPKLMGILAGDQDWITQCIPNAKMWQDVAEGLIGSYKADNLINSARGFHIVCFHGDPKPHTFTEGWIHDYWRI